MKSRIKSEESYQLRMKRLNLEVAEVNDLTGFCFVLKAETDCYEVLEQIKNIKEIEVLEIKDYISKPCGVNNYQALHINFRFNDILGEIQLKTNEMYIHAEKTYEKYKNSCNSIKE